MAGMDFLRRMAYLLCPGWYAADSLVGVTDCRARLARFRCRALRDEACRLGRRHPLRHGRRGEEPSLR